MIMTVAEFRRFVEASEDDSLIEDKLSAIELLIRAYTNNNFQVRALRAVAVASAANNAFLVNGTAPFKVGDTLQVTESETMPNSLVTVTAITDGTITVDGEIYDESGVVITKVNYPQDVKQGVINLMKWELNNRDKVGVQSETISRHSVTYFSMDGDNSIMGYPKSLMGFLRPYMKARFGQGLRV